MAPEPGTQESVAQESGATKTSAKKAASKKKSSKQSAPKKRAGKKPAPNKSVAKKATKKKLAAKKSVATKSVPKKRKTKKQPAVQINKAQAIRDEAKELGKKARPRDIIAALKAKGISVSSPQVSTTLKAAGLRRGRRRKKAKAAVVATNGHGGLNINELVLVKKLAEQLGGTKKLKELVVALERLV
jgi:hypothetical protein